MKNLKFLFFLIALIMSTEAFAQSTKPVSEYLNIPGPLSFQNKSFNLAWSSHPADYFYKQEYIEKGDIVDKFKNMILIDVIKGETNVKNVVGLKVAELKRMKEANPYVNYEVIENPKTGEIMIDFLLTANAADGSISIVERSVYRYKAFTDKTGNKGIMLFGIANRSYGADVDKFFSSLKTNRKDLINLVSQYKMPEINIKS